MSNDMLIQSTDQRRFVMVYNDFLESDKLDCYEKLVYIIIKRYADYNTQQAFPSLNRIAKIAGICRSTVQRCIAHLQELGALTVEHRTNEETGEYTSNMYTLHDYAWMWQDVPQDDQAELDEDARAIERLRARGYEVQPQDQGKKNVSAENEKADQSTVHMDDTNQPTDNDNQTEPVAQDASGNFSMDAIHAKFGYEQVVEQDPADCELIDAAMDVLYEVYNKRSGNMRVNGGHMAMSKIKERYDQLTPEIILYAINKYKGNQKAVTRQRAYMRTLLYVAKGQMAMECVNQNKVAAAEQERQNKRDGSRAQEYDMDGIERALMGE